MHQKCVFVWLCVVLSAGVVFAEPVGGTVVSPAVLASAGLRMDWQINLPLKKGENIDRMFVEGQYLYVLTSRNYLFCIERSGGEVHFAIPFTAQGLPVSRHHFSGDRLYFMVGNELVTLNPVSGIIESKRKIDALSGTIIRDFGMNSKNLYFLGQDRKLRAIATDGYWQLFGVSADDNSLINSLVVNEDFVVFTTETGSVVRIASDSPTRRWQFDIPGRITAPLVRDGQSLYVGSENTKLYRFDVTTGQKTWPGEFQAGAKITEPVVTGADVLYLYAEPAGLYAISKQNGEKLWQLEKGLGLVAENGDRAYVLAEPGTLMVMDNKTKTAVCSVNCASLTKYAVNTTDAKLYLSDDKGRTISVSPADKK